MKYTFYLTQYIAESVNCGDIQKIEDKAEMDMSFPSIT